jgi:hypothetical protein
MPACTAAGRRVTMIRRMDWLGVDRHRAGTGLLGFGIVGVVLAGIIALALVGGAIAARNLDDRLAADQAQLVAMLDRLTATIDRLATGTMDASMTLETTGDIVADTGGILTDIATTTDGLAGALDVSIVGNRPFAGAADDLRRLASRVDGFAGRTTTLAANLDADTADLTDLAARTRTMRDDVAAIAARLTAFDRTAEIVNLLVGGILLAGLLVAWVGVAAALCAWAGWRLRRPAVPGPAATGSRDQPGATRG